MQSLIKWLKKPAIEAINLITIFLKSTLAAVFSTVLTVLIVVGWNKILGGLYYFLWWEMIFIAALMSAWIAFYCRD